jgi:quercetin dioxygenase-like cupin family protein
MRKREAAALFLVLVGTAALTTLVYGQGGAAQSPKPAAQQGVVYRSPAGTTLRLMLDENNLGTEVSLGELTFPPNQDSGEHAHEAIEIFYVVSGELEHVVNGKSEFLKPGMSGFVRPPDKVRHKTGPAGAKVVVVWAPGIEGRRVASRWTREP